MAEEPLRPSPTDPPDRPESTCFLPTSKRRNNQKASRTSTHPPTTPSMTPTTPSSSQQTTRPLASELEANNAGKARKRQATAGHDDRPTPPDPEYLGTPRSTWLKNIFIGAMAPPRILDVARKLNDLVENNVKLPKKGAEKISIGSETAADIKTLVAKFCKLAEFNDNIPALRRDPFAADDDDHRVERALAGPNMFGCKVPDAIEAKLDQLTKSLERIKRSTSNFNFKVTKQKTNTTTPSYSLAASKHAPNTVAPPRHITFKPTPVRKPPTPPPTAIKTTNTLTLAQTVKDGKVLANMNYPTLITSINSKLAEAGIKEKPDNDKPIRIRSVHRHPSNDLVVYTTTAAQANILRESHERWVHLVSEGLTLHNPVHTVVVHGIPTSFNPTDPQHLTMLCAMNTDTLEPPPLFVKWLSANAVERGTSHSSIRLGFADANQAKLAVDQKIFYGRFNKRTEYGRKSRPRCMNCLKEGHVTRYCKEALMCPHCSENHTTESCELHGKMTTNCTVCARQAKHADPKIDLAQVFSEAPRHLRHSPLDPTCPARLADKTARATDQATSRPQVNPATPGSAQARSETIIIPDASPSGPAGEVDAASAEDDADMLL